MSITSSESIEKRKRQQLLQKILNRQVTGEAYITTSATVWKSITLKHFNKIMRKEMTVPQLLDLLERKGVVFNQKREIIVYPIREFLMYIAKETKQNFDI